MKIIESAVLNEIEREHFFLMPSWTPYVMWLIFFITLIFFLYGLRKRYKAWKIGKLGNKYDSISYRLKLFIYGWAGQKKILKELLIGFAHGGIFLGFLLLLLGTLLVFFEYDILPIFSKAKILIGTPYLFYELILDLAGLMFVGGVLLALYRRIIVRPKWIKTTWEDIILLIILLLLGIVGFLLEGIRLAVRNPDWGIWSIFGYIISRFLIYFKVVEPFANAYIFLWWFHAINTFIFIAIIPYTKFFHILTAPTTIFLKEIKKKGELTTPFDIENLKDDTVMGAKTTDSFTRSQRISFDGCSTCYRCEKLCPAHNSDKPLSPRNLIKQLSDITREIKKTDNYMISEDEIWSCTTCYACANECPVEINPVSLLIDMRRYLVLSEGKFPAELQTFFKNMENNYNPWAITSASRGEWASELGIKEYNGNEYLFWVGCSASFDERNKKVARGFAKILTDANIDFGILGANEKCCGETARRCGNEYLAQTLIKENIKALKEVKKIITTCPHCYNTLKNEYPQFGFVSEVYHHSEILEKLIKSGKVKFNKYYDGSYTYHDSCYLGRYNEIYDEPRKILRDIRADELVEMERAREKSFCCGAGGGRMWLEEKIGKNINVIRLEEAINNGIKNIITACPYCLTMFEDAVKKKEMEGRIEVLDLAEVLERSREWKYELESLEIVKKLLSYGEKK